MSRWHQIFSGSSLHWAAGVFALAWFTMDTVEWVDWLNGKLNPPQQTFCVRPEEVRLLIEYQETDKLPLMHIVWCPK